jgi:tRNA-specific adenosine deaminase 1
LILPASQYSATGCRRAFSAEEGGRMAGVGDGGGGGGYGFRPFRVETTALEFAWSKRTVGKRLEVSGEKAKLAASNLAVAWTKGAVQVEATLGGTMQGRKAFDPRGASFASRRKMWALAVEVGALLGIGLVEVQKALAARSYREVKGSGLLEARRRAKRDAKASALKGWVRNEGDEDFSL